MTKYKCGHEVNTIIMQDSILSITSWMDWKDTKGFNGDKSECFDCWCDNK